MIVWRLIRAGFLLIAIACLGYTGWIYFDEYWHQRQESEAFDRTREKQRPTAREIPLVRYAGPMKARLQIPRLRLTTMVEEGVSQSILRRSAGHIPGTALPGRPGNVGVAAHRDTQFRSLSGIRKRDRILLSTLDGDYKYEVVSTNIVSPEDVTVLAPSIGQNTLTLVTCYPFYFVGHAPKRFIVRARQIDSAGWQAAKQLDVTNTRASDLTAIHPQLWRASRPAYPTAARKTQKRARTNRRTSPRNQLVLKGRQDLIVTRD
jgi:sortase A